MVMCVNMHLSHYVGLEQNAFIYNSHAVGVTVNVNAIYRQVYT